jgi:quinolinate synthase
VKRVDASLSRELQAAYPDALVFCKPEGPSEVWWYSRQDGQTTGLGASFSEARASVQVIVKAELARKGS